MADYTNMTVVVKSDNPDVLTQAQECVLQCLNDPETYENEIDGHELCIGAHEVRVDALGEVVDALEVLIEEMQEFAFSVHTDPKYEWLGETHTYVPGVGVHMGECDSEGTVVVTSNVLAAAVAQSEDFDSLRANILSLSGEAITEAFHNYLAPEPAPVA